jgi:asparagine synthase (glutamine-hydrolysing)
MGGIFGCFGNKCNDIYPELEASLDKSRGNILHVIQGRNYVMGIQEHRFIDADTRGYDSDKVAITFFSDTAKPDFRSIESHYLNNGFKGLTLILLQSVNADYALTLFDLGKKRAFLICDPIGIRKLYYTIINNALIYSSSLKHLVSLLEKYNLFKDMDSYIDAQALRVYLAYGVLPIDLTLIKYIYKLQMDKAVSFDVVDSKLTEITIATQVQSYSEVMEEGLIKRTYELLQTSIKERAESSNAILLSGGIDSGLIASILISTCPNCQNIAVNVYYGSYSERENARKISQYLGIKLIEKGASLDSPELSKLLNETVKFLDEPNARGNFIGRYYALQELQEYASAAFLGEGGDELFLGYWPNYWYWYRQPIVVLASLPFVKMLIKIISNVVEKVNINMLNRIISAVESSENIDLALMTRFMNTNYFTLKSLFPHIDPKDFTDQKMILKVKPYPDIISRTSFLLFMLLTQSDVTVDENVCSRLGLKLKLPYLDPRLVGFAFSLDSRYKLKGNTTKYLLRKVAEQYRLLPLEIIQQKKKGFTTPFFTEGFDKELLLQELRECTRNTHNIFLRKIFYYSGGSNDLSLMIEALVLCKWYENLKGVF